MLRTAAGISRIWGSTRAAGKLLVLKISELEVAKGVDGGDSGDASVGDGWGRRGKFREAQINGQ
jgi:hypothetical protein